MADIKEQEGKPTRITLDPDEACMIFSTKYDIPVILIPSGNDPDEMVEEHILQCVKLAMALNDPVCQARMEEMMDEGLEATTLTDDEAVKLLKKDETES